MNASRLTLAEKAAKLTGEKLLDTYHHGDRSGFLKEDRTMVTLADRAADRMIEELILGEYPEDKILSEEGSTIFPNSQHVWIVDPLDGTVNFSRGLGYWGVSIAHLEDGVPQTAALFFPVTNELFTAVHGKGAKLNGQPLSVCQDFDESLDPLFVHCSRMHQRYEVNLPYKKRSLGAAAYHLCLIANNKAVLAFESTVRIWDFAASWLIIKEAGGLIESYGDKQPFPAQSGTDYHKIPFPIIAAVSNKILIRARKNIIPKEFITGRFGDEI